MSRYWTAKIRSREHRWNDTLEIEQFSRSIYTSINWFSFFNEYDFSGNDFKPFFFQKKTFFAI